jgi:hypothetical protein
MLREYTCPARKRLAFWLGWMHGGASGFVEQMQTFKQQEF